MNLKVKNSKQILFEAIDCMIVQFSKEGRNRITGASWVMRMMSLCGRTENFFCGNRVEISPQNNSTLFSSLNLLRSSNQKKTMS